MKNWHAGFIAMVLVGAGGMGVYAIMKYHGNRDLQDALSKVKIIETDATTVKQELLGFTKYTDYLSAGKQALSQQMKFLAATVVREYVFLETIQKSVLTLTSEATVSVNYSVEYSFGFDLKPESFEILPIPGGIAIKINKPSLVAAPAVTPQSRKILSKGLLTDEKMAVIDIQQRLSPLALEQGKAMALEEPVRALCEKQLIAFLRDFLAKQPGVRQIPAISIVYK